MEIGRHRNRNGGAIFWVVVVLAIALAIYFVFGIMGIQDIRGKMDEAMGRKPPTPAKGNEGALMIHQERMRQEDEAREKMVNEVMAIQAEAAAQNKVLRKEMREAGTEMPPPPRP